MFLPEKIILPNTNLNKSNGLQKLKMSPNVNTYADFFLVYYANILNAHFFPLKIKLSD